MELSEKQFPRYARHLILDDLGEEGKEKLLASGVLARGRPAGSARPASLLLVLSGPANETPDAAGSSGVR